MNPTSTSSSNPLTISEQAPVWLASLRARRKPVSPATLYLWESLLNSRVLPVLGTVEIASFENGAMRMFIDHLCSLHLAPRTIRDITLIVKKIIASVIDPNGNLIHARVWNSNFLNAPPIVNQEMECPTAETVSNAVRTAPARWARLIAVLAGTGLRIGELASLRTFNDGHHSYVGDGVLHIRSSIWQGGDIATKTASGVRDVYLCSMLAEIISEQARDRHGFLFGRDPLRPIAQASARKVLARYGIKGFHSLRRFRTTTLRANGCPESIIQAEIGHARESITDLYDKSARNVALRREWAETIGLGFELHALSVTEAEVIECPSVMQPVGLAR